MAIDYAKNVARIRKAGLAPIPRTGSISIVMDALGDLEIPWTQLATGPDAQDVYVRGGIANVIVAADTLANEHGIELRDAIARLTAGLPRAWLTSLRADVEGPTGDDDPAPVAVRKRRARASCASRDRKSDRTTPGSSRARLSLPESHAIPMLPVNAGPDCYGEGV